MRPSLAAQVLATAAAVLGLACSAKDGASRSGGSCRALSASSTGPGDANHLFPVSQGSTWSYQIARSDPSQPLSLRRERVRAGVPRQLSGLSATTFTVSDLDDPSAAVQERFLASGPSGLTFVPGPSADPLDRTIGPYQLLRFPVSAGDTFVQSHCDDISSGEDLDGDGRVDLMDLHSEVTVIGDEQIWVPAGTFTATRVETRAWVSIQTATGAFASEATEVDWFAPGVGLVRSLSVDGEGVEEDEQLIGYRIEGGGEAGFLDAWTLATNVAPANSDTTTPGRPAIVFDGSGNLLASWVATGMAGVDGLRAWQIGPDLSVEPSLAVIDGIGSGGAVSPPVAAFDGTSVLVIGPPCGGCGAPVAQRITPAGVRLDGASGFELPSGGSTVYAPSVASDGAGWLTAWTEYLGTGIRTASIGPDGTVAGGGLLGAPFSTWPSGPVVAGGAGSYLVAWAEDATELRAVRVASDGTPLDADPITISSVVSAKEAAGIAWDGTSFLVVWLDARRGALSDPGYRTSDVYAARVAPDGTVLDPGGFAVNARPGVTKGDVSVGAIPGGFGVAWAVFGYDSPAGIYAARVTSGGALLEPASGPGIEVARPTEYASQLVHPVVVEAVGGRTLVVWVVNREMSGTAKSIQAARFAW
jgi:hypothetical protein